MLGEKELEDFFAHIDEISQDSVCPDTNQQILKLKSENSRLKVLLSNLRSSTKEVLGIVKNERQLKLHAIQELERSKIELENLRKSYDELDKSNVNHQFKYNESINELELKHQDVRENYIELSKDYFEVLSEVTLFCNYEVKKDRNKILCKTSKFLDEALGGAYKKPKIAHKRLPSDSKSTGSKRSRNGKKENPTSAKRKKLDIWEMKSISEASSPMSFHEDHNEETTENESICSFKTFSIGNETAFSSLASRKINMKSFRCQCKDILREPDLVSVGVNTEDVQQPQSMPSFNDNEFVLNQDDFITSSLDGCSQTVKDAPQTESPTDSLKVHEPELPVIVPDELPLRQVKTVSVSTSTEFTILSKNTKDQSTSPMVLEKCNQSTSTVHSVTHRGTMTPSRVTRNIGVQFPEMTFEKILEEMSFDLPSCISPIRDEINVRTEIETSSKETQTNLHNVNREVDYIHQNGDDKKISSEEQSFISLGQTVFNLFMNRLKETNKSLSDDAHTRQRLREQLLDRFDELTFDEYFSPSFVSAEAQESVLRKVFEDVSDTKCSKKDGYEIKAVETRSDLSLDEEMEDSGVDSSQNKASEDMEMTSHKELEVSPATSLESFLSATKTQDSSQNKSAEITEMNLLELEVSPATSLESMLSITKTMASYQQKTVDNTDVNLLELEVSPATSYESIMSLTKPVVSSLNKTVDNTELEISRASSTESIPSLTKYLETTQSSPVYHAELEISPICSSVCLQTSPKDYGMINYDENSKVNRIKELFGDSPTSASDTSISVEESKEIWPISSTSSSSTSLPECEFGAEKILELFCTSPRKMISPILDLDDLIWSTLFPDTQESDGDSPKDDENVLAGYELENEPLEIPLLAENGTDSPHPPPDFAIVTESPYAPIEIPISNGSVCQRNLTQGKVLEFDPKMRLKLVTYQQSLQLKKVDDKRLCKIRKSITNYLNSDWTNENLQKCMEEISNRRSQLLVEAIFETIEDNQWQWEVNSEFTPPAPPLPRYQQKLILLISKLAENHKELPHDLVNDLEMRLFKCENSSVDLIYLRNVAYYYTSLIDLFFDGDPTVVFYFIIKCLYFYGYKAIPMVFVLIKAFPQALPKKSQLLKKYSTNVDWEKMTGLEMSKIRLDLEWMDSLDLCVMYLLTNIQMYRRKGQEFKVIYEHELFNYLPKIYGFPLSFIAAPKLLDVLIKRLENGELKNLSMSLILLGKRMNKDFTVRMLLKGKLLPILKKYVDESLKNEEQPMLVDKICVLIECISTILKPLTDEKDKIFNEIFPMIVNILGRTNSQLVQEYCIKAVLRLQRFIENHKEIYEIIQHHYEKRNAFSESLQHAIVTFVHRKKEAYFKE